jgi:hypothetical protein
MPPLTTNRKVGTANSLTRKQFISVPHKLLKIMVRMGDLRSGSLMLFVRVEFFDKCHAIDFVQG